MTTSYNLSNIVKAAHKIASQLAEMATDRAISYRAFFSQALKQAWAMAKNFTPVLNFPHVLVSIQKELDSKVEVVSPEVVEISESGSGKITEKQAWYIRNVVGYPHSFHRLQKYMSFSSASEAISAHKSGKVVKFV